MKVVRTTLNELVERRLWPVALALAVALVAVPLLIGRGAGGADTTTPPAPAPAATTASGTVRAAVEVETDTTADANARTGKVRNPFVQLGAPKADTASTSADAAAAGSGAAAAAPAEAPAASGSTSGGSSSGGSSDGATGDGTGSAGADGGSTPASEPSLAPRTVTLGFVQVGGKQREYTDLARLSALPSADKPVFVYLGVRDDGETAVFLVSEHATVTGDGTCRPSPESCKAIELEQGQAATVTVQEGAATVQYSLDLSDIDPITSTKADVVAAAIARHSVAGAELVRAAHLRGDEGFAGKDRYRWLPTRSGLLYRIPATVLAKLAAEGSDAVTLPGEPVWHHELGS